MLCLVLSRSGFCSTDRFHENGPTHIFLFWSEAGKFKICNQNSEKNREYCHSSQWNYHKKLKRLHFFSEFQRWMKKTNIQGSQAGVVDINHAFHLCGLSFSRSQPDFEGFLRALRFPPSSKLTSSLIHLAVVLCSDVIYGSCSGPERLAGSTAPWVRPHWAAPFAYCEKGWLAGKYYYYY